MDLKLVLRMAPPTATQLEQELAVAIVYEHWNNVTANARLSRLEKMIDGFVDTKSFAPYIAKGGDISALNIELEAFVTERLPGFWFDFTITTK